MWLLRYRKLFSILPQEGVIAMIKNTRSLDAMYSTLQLTCACPQSGHARERGTKWNIFKEAECCRANTITSCFKLLA